MTNKIDIKSVLTNSRNYMLFGLICIAIGLSLSKPLISLGYIILFFSWIIDGNLIEKLKRFYRNKTALMLVGIYLITVFGLLNTTNFEYGLDDTRRKMFLFVMPFLLSGFSSITHKELHLLLKAYIIGILTASLWSLFVYLGGLNIEIYDVRDLSRFNSHIRFGLEIVLAIFFSTYYWNRENNKKFKWVWFFLLCWFLLSLFLFKLFTGAVVLVLSSLILMFVLGLYSRKKKFKYLLISAFPLVVFASVWFITDCINDYKSDANVEPIKQLERTKYGEKYHFDDNIIHSLYKENGYYIERHIAWYEFAATWNNRSKLDINGKDLKGNFLKTTLIRFVTSKGLRKDREAIESLTDEEIRAIERGIANVKYMDMGFLRLRMHKIIWEFDNYYNGGNYNGHSVIMRWVYWKTAFKIISNNLMFGVGTGDVQDAFNEVYENENAILEKEYWHRAHNQYITYGVSFGLIGVIMFFCFLFIPPVRTKMLKNYLFLSFFAVICLSMLTEDTLETQVGINLFIFFNSIFLIHEPKPNQ